MTLKENGINNNDSCIPSFLWETIPELTIREKKGQCPKCTVAHDINIMAHFFFLSHDKFHSSHNEIKKSCNKLKSSHDKCKTC